MPLGAAVVGSAAIGGAVQSHAAKDAAKTQSAAATQAAQIQADAAREAGQLQRDVYTDQRGLATPGAEAGAAAFARQMVMAGLSEDEARSYYNSVVAAYQNPFGGDTAHDGALSPASNTPANNPSDSLGDLSAFAPQTFQHDPFSFDGSDLTDDPSYQWRLDQGTKAVEHSQAARGHLFSGQTGEALQDYGQGLASTEYQAAYGRAADTYDRNYTNDWNQFQTNDTNKWNRLGALSGAGADAEAHIIDAGNNYADGASDTLMAAGNAEANGINAAGIANAQGQLNQGQAWGSFFNDTVPGALGWYSWGKK